MNEPKHPEAVVVMYDRLTIGKVRAALAASGASREDVDAFEAEARGGNGTYADVLRAALRWVTVR